MYFQSIRYYAEAEGIVLQGGGMSPGAVSVGHLVVFDEKELQLLIIANSEYNLDVEGDVGTTQWQLREGALEKHVVERSVSTVLIAYYDYRYCNKWLIVTILAKHIASEIELSTVILLD